MAPPVTAPAPSPTPLDEARTPVFDAEAYRDVFRILGTENSCSRFFGGPARALEAFNEFARRLEKRPLEEPAVALRMEGQYTNYRNARTGASFRIFDRSVVNSAGPFFQQDKPAKRTRMRVGRFAAATRPARALVLLHELGHLVADDEGKWLLPNDGADMAQSERNTLKVQDRCLAELLALER